MDGVRFPNNKQMKFRRLEPVLDGAMIHAEGRWANGDADPRPGGQRQCRRSLRAAVRACHGEAG